jgi:hypothetical protein
MLVYYIHDLIMTMDFERSIISYNPITLEDQANAIVSFIKQINFNFPKDYSNIHF